MRVRLIRASQLKRGTKVLYAAGGSFQPREVIRVRKAPGEKALRVTWVGDPFFEDWIPERNHLLQIDEEG